MKWSILGWRANHDTGAAHEASINAEADRRRGKPWEKDVNAELTIYGADFHVHTIKLETDYGGGIGTVGAEGPNAGIDVGVKTGTDFTGVALMAEASAIKAEVTLGPAYLSGNINANTGVKMGSGGFQLNILGWGATLGVGGR
ncbi:unnamed protein product [Oppiella nova]|uniref:Uncharacterized protein n=1 Tax=Oppiella nova TaxID=334625 RepID=A0A7R9QRE5_9ACAR|nr:unnamed protein product [Oppiella nova]CAG2172199.1 unnamed protein product [Oppiella nova]